MRVDGKRVIRMNGLSRLLLLAAIWGSGFFLIRLALTGFSPIQATFLRLFFGSATLLLLTRIRGLRLPTDGKTWRHFAVAGVIANALPYFLFAVGTAEVGSSVAGSINATSPLWALSLAFLSRTERFPVRRVVGIAIGLAGTIILLAPWDKAAGATAFGAVMCVLAAISYGVAYIYMDRYLVPLGLSPIVLAAGQMVAATGLVLLVMPFLGRGPVDLTPVAVSSVIALGVLGNGLGYILNYRLIADDGPTIASTVTYLIPVVAITLGVLILDEPASLHLLIGTAIVLAGVALVRAKIDRRQAETVDEALA